MNTSHNLLGASDILSIADALIEAAFMAAGSLGDPEAANAIQQVCSVAQKHIIDARGIIETVRKEVRQ